MDLANQSPLRRVRPQSNRLQQNRINHDMQQSVTNLNQRLDFSNLRIKINKPTNRNRRFSALPNRQKDRQNIFMSETSNGHTPTYSPKVKISSNTLLKEKFSIAEPFYQSEISPPKQRFRIIGHRPQSTVRDLRAMK